MAYNEQEPENIVQNMMTFDSHSLNYTVFITVTQIMSNFLVICFKRCKFKERIDI